MQNFKSNLFYRGHQDINAVKIEGKSGIVNKMFSAKNDYQNEYIYEKFYMRLFSFLFIFLAINLAAQGQRFIYDYDFIPDSTKLAEIKSEEMYLDRSANKSLFYSNVAFKNDSLMKANLEKQLQMTGALQINMDQKKRN